MSIAHIRLMHAKQNAHHVEYEVESIDFNIEHEWEIIGKLMINVEGKDYTFSPSNILLDKKILPPSFFYRLETENVEKLREEYKSYTHGAWAGAIHVYALTLIRRNEFPHHYPATDFPELTDLTSSLS